MIRFRNLCTVKYGQFREYFAACEELNAICRARGWAQATVLTPVAGLDNQVIVEFEYPDIETFNRESTAAQTDVEFMKVFRSTAEMIYPESGRSELLEVATQIA
jgi:hypothetical protein